MRDRGRPASSRQDKGCRDDDVQKIGDVELLRVDAGSPEAGEQEVDKRRRQHRGDEIRDSERSEQRHEPVASVGSDDEPERDRTGESQRHGERDLGCEQQLKREQRSEPDDELPSGEFVAHVAEHDERDQRDQEDGRHVEMSELLAEHVAREAEQVAADKRRPQLPGQVAAEKERRPRSERGHEHSRDVVGRNGAGRKRQRREEQREPRHCGRPGEVDAGRRPDCMGDERILPVQDRVREPGERPDEDLRVRSGADVARAVTGQQAQPEIRKRDCRVKTQRGDSAQTAP